MLDLEINVKIQATKPTNEELAETFAVALESFAATIRSGGLAKHLDMRGDDVNGVMEVQATTSYINSMERKALEDIARIDIRLRREDTSDDTRIQLTQLREDLMETINSIREGYDEDTTIRMYKVEG